MDDDAEPGTGEFMDVVNGFPLANSFHLELFPSSELQ